MMHGMTPFYGPTGKDLMNCIIKKNPKISKSLSLEAIDIIKKLLCKNGLRRLGGRGDAEEVKAHVFFTNINWKAIIMNRNIPPTIEPMKDLVQNKTSEISENIEADSPYTDKTSFMDSYSNFSYKIPDNNNDKHSNEADWFK